MTRSTGSEGLAVHRVGGGAMAERAVALLQAALTAGAAPADLCVLTRVNSALLPVQVALTEAGIAHTAPLDATVLQRTGIRTALAYLRLGLDTDRLRRADVLDTLNRPARKVKSAVTPLLPRRSPWSIGTLEQVGDQLSETHRQRFSDYLGDLLDLSSTLADGGDTARALAVIRQRIGLGEAMDALDSSRRRPEGSSHGDDLDALEQLAALQPDPARFETWLSERLRVPGAPTGITLSTVHRVKGMEWSQVVVFAANQGLFPHRLADDVEEERRVFHVAITRCQEQVHVVADTDRASPFLEELTTPPRARSTATARSRPHGHPAHAEPTFDATGQLHAARGVEVTLAGGITGRISALGRHHVVVELTDGDGPAVQVRVPHGNRLHAGGRSCLLTGPRGAGGPTSEVGAARRAGQLDVQDAADVAADDALFATLKEWRSKVARSNGVPAYLVFQDRHLQLIAGRRPHSLNELAACPGVGPAKLERYGDDLLDLVAQSAETP